MNTIEEKRKQRFQFLKRLYELSGGDKFKSFEMFEIGKELGFDKKLTANIAQYLEGEMLIEYIAFGGIIAITHNGIVEVEEALSNPDEPTEHFPALNIISVGQMVNSQIQQASPQSIQLITIDQSKINEIKQFLSELKKSIDQLGLIKEQVTELQSEIKTIEAQITSSKPKSIILTESLKTIRNILEGVAGGFIASGLLQSLNTFFIP